MKSYGQFCPVAKAAEIFCERWTALILRELSVGSERFTDIHRGVPLMSPTLLSQRLKQLEAEKVIVRRRSASGAKWTYHLTPAGREFVPLVEALCVWGQRWTRRELAENEIDLGLLLWALERGVNPDAFGAERTVIALTFSDQPKGKAHWWLVNVDGRCEICVDDPGHPVDLYMTVSLVDIIYVVRGDLPLDRALAEDRIEVLGDAEAARRLGAWFNLPAYTQIRSARWSEAAE